MGVVGPQFPFGVKWNPVRSLNLTAFRGQKENKSSWKPALGEGVRKQLQRSLQFYRSCYCSGSLTHLCVNDQEDSLTTIVGSRMKRCRDAYAEASKRDAGNDEFYVPR